MESFLGHEENPYRLPTLIGGPKVYGKAWHLETGPILIKVG